MMPWVAADVDGLMGTRWYREAGWGSLAAPVQSQFCLQVFNGGTFGSSEAGSHNLSYIFLTCHYWCVADGDAPVIDVIWRCRLSTGESQDTEKNGLMKISHRLKKQKTICRLTKSPAF